MWIWTLALVECGSDSWQSDSEDYFDVEHSAAVGQAQHSKYHIIHLYVCLHVRGIVFLSGEVATYIG